MTKLPADIEVLEPLAGAFREVHYRLPPRTHASVKETSFGAFSGSIVFVLIPVAFSVFAVFAIPPDEVKSSTPYWMPIAFFGTFCFPIAAILSAFGIIHRYSRFEIICRPQQLAVRRNLGPLTWTRHLPLAGLRGFRVQSTPTDTSCREVTSLFADYDRRSSQIICTGYEPDWLASLAHELTRRCELLSADHASLAITIADDNPLVIEARSEQPTNSDAHVLWNGASLIIEHPPRGWRRALPFPVQVIFSGWFGFVFLYSLGLFTNQIHWEGGSEKVPFWLGLLLGSPLYFIGICCLATWYAHARYTARWEVSSKELRFWDRMLFGDGTEIWQRSELQSIRVSSRQAENDNTTWITSLQTASRDKPAKDLFSGRDKSELEWLATTLSKALELPL